jgi:hypothetical protein
MFGAFSGAVGAANGPQSGSESRISSSILPLNSFDSVAIAGLTLVVDLPAAHGHYTWDQAIAALIRGSATLTNIPTHLEVC